jgi:hypothetical protein
VDESSSVSLRELGVPGDHVVLTMANEKIQPCRPFHNLIEKRRQAPYPQNIPRPNPSATADERGYLERNKTWSL